MTMTTNDNDDDDHDDDQNNLMADRISSILFCIFIFWSGPMIDEAIGFDEKRKKKKNGPFVSSFSFSLHTAYHRHLLFM